MSSFTVLERIEIAEGKVNSALQELSEAATSSVVTSLIQDIDEEYIEISDKLTSLEKMVSQLTYQVELLKKRNIGNS